MKKLDFNSFLTTYYGDPLKAKLGLVHSAASAMLEYVQDGTYDPYDVYCPNYAELCRDVLGWPDLQDGGLFEQCIDQAADLVLAMLGCKPRTEVPKRSLDMDWQSLIKK